MRITSLLAPSFALCLVAACQSYGGGDVATFSIALDIHGVSNSQCTMTIANDDRHLTFDIPPPDPAVVETTPGVPAPAAQCTRDSGDAAATVMVTAPEGVVFDATRTSTGLCVRSSDNGLLRELGYSLDETNMCPVVVTLTCGGVVVYDRVAWTACTWLG